MVTYEVFMSAEVHAGERSDEDGHKKQLRLTAQSREVRLWTYVNADHPFALLATHNKPQETFILATPYATFRQAPRTRRHP